MNSLDSKIHLKSVSEIRGSEIRGIESPKLRSENRDLRDWWKKFRKNRFRYCIIYRFRYCVAESRNRKFFYKFYLMSFFLSDFLYDPFLYDPFFIFFLYFLYFYISILVSLSYIIIIRVSLYKYHRRIIKYHYKYHRYIIISIIDIYKYHISIIEYHYISIILVSY